MNGIHHLYQNVWLECLIYIKKLGLEFLIYMYIQTFGWNSLSIWKVWLKFLIYMKGLTEIPNLHGRFGWNSQSTWKVWLKFLICLNQFGRISYLLQTRFDRNSWSTSKMNVRENRRCNQEWTIQRHWQHWAHKTQDEDKQTQKTKKIKNMDLTKYRWWTLFLPNGKQYPPLIRHSPSYSYSQDVFDTTIRKQT